MKVSKEAEVSIKKNIFKKSKSEINKLKSLKANLSVPFTNSTIIHINADFNRDLTDVRHKLQRKYRDNGK